MQSTRKATVRLAYTRIMCMRLELYGQQAIRDKVLADIWIEGKVLYNALLEFAPVGATERCLSMVSPCKFGERQS
jgi:hypothetical protein